MVSHERERSRPREKRERHEKTLKTRAPERGMLFHATDKKHLPEIAKHGLQASKMDRENIARLHQDFMRWEYGERITLKEAMRDLPNVVFAADDPGAGIMNAGKDSVIIGIDKDAARDFERRSIAALDEYVSQKDVPPEHLSIIRQPK
jgi:hypothetical protein